MRDFDFDEIDRAVASTMQTDKPEGAPAQSEKVEVNSTSNRSTPATRRSGRFMDVVHPSSDMRTATVPERVVEDSKTTEVRDELVVPERDASEKSSTDMPDPLDFHGFNDDQEKPEEKPQDSPFIANPQIEKRPLGGYPTSETAQTDIPQPSFDIANSPTIEDEQSQQIEPETKPEEIVETAEVIEESVQAPEPVEQEVSEQSEPEPATPVEPEQPAGPVEITQQYKEHRSGSEQESGAIYDTESYHQPLTKPSKKKSGIWIVLWIFALIAVGAGVGAAVYFFVLPQL